jgi:hypothetical protein
MTPNGLSRRSPSHLTGAAAALADVVGGGEDEGAGALVGGVAMATTVAEGAAWGGIGVGCCAPQATPRSVNDARSVRPVGSIANPG